MISIPGRKQPTYAQALAACKNLLAANASLAQLAQVQGQALGHIKCRAAELSRTIRDATFPLPRESKIADALDIIVRQCGRSDDFLDKPQAATNQPAPQQPGGEIPNPPGLHLAKPDKPAVTGD